MASWTEGNKKSHRLHARPKIRGIVDQNDPKVVFGSDYCGGLGPLEKALPVIADQPNPARVKLNETHSACLGSENEREKNEKSVML
jgi:hypothetical protein